MQNIVKHIPFGKQNAITRMELANITNLTDREVRRLISEARTETVILSVYGGKGYFRPTQEEKTEVEKWLRREHNRAVSTFKAMKAARIFVKRG